MNTTGATTVISDVTQGDRKRIFLVSISFASLILGGLFSLAGDALQPNPAFIVALACLLACVALVPAIVSMRVHKGGVDLFNPLAYSAWFFFIPQFSVAALLIVMGVLEVSPTIFFQGTLGPLVLSLEYAILGSIGLSAGFFLPLGKRFGKWLPQFKDFDLSRNQLRFPTLLLLCIGYLSYGVAFVSGSYGYQLTSQVSTYGSLFVQIAQIQVIGQGIVWFSFFTERRGWRMMALLSLGLILANAFLSGARGALLNSTILMVAAYLYAQHNIRLRMLWKWTVVFIVVIFVGLVFGSYFRQTKTIEMGRSTSMTFNDVTSVSMSTLPIIQNQDLGELANFATDRLTERINGVYTLAFIVSFADYYKPTEEAWGINDNISRDLQTAFIPRFIYSAKPTVGVSEQLGNLYFGTIGTSPGITYMGDLYRNFGPWSIIPGMLLVGIALRSIYAWLIEGRPQTPVRVGVFLMLLFAANYEGLYSTYFPGLARYFIIAILAVVTIKIVMFFKTVKK